jgi:motility quorum-sensing regulator / GCU-specific mRNA interferase toxin
VVSYSGQVEKRKPTYDLISIKTEFSTVEGLRMTASARTTAFALGFTLEGVVNLIQTITREHFYKSMTSHADHTVWQDVYQVPHEEIVLYVKFTVDIVGHLVISLKEK